SVRLHSVGVIVVHTDRPVSGDRTERAVIDDADRVGETVDEHGNLRLMAREADGRRYGAGGATVRAAGGGGAAGPSAGLRGRRAPAPPGPRSRPPMPGVGTRRGTAPAGSASRRSPR